MMTLYTTSVQSGLRFWGLWMLASIAGVIAAIMVLAPMNWLLLTSGNRAIPAWLDLSLALFGAAALGGGIGAGQWLVLRRWLARSGWWVLATLLGYSLLLVLPPVVRLSAFTPPGRLASAMTGALMFVVTGAGMGVLQWLVLRRARIPGAGVWIAITLAGWASAYIITTLFIISGLYMEPMDMLFAFLIPVAVAGAALARMLRMKLHPALDHGIQNPSGGAHAPRQAALKDEGK